jgi:prepilin-type N-terminal cleavage/methylation domain-containing protein
MNSMLKFTLMDDQGFSLIELVIVIAIISVLAVIVGINANQWLNKYNAESKIRQMHADLMQARVQAMQYNRQYSVVVNTNSYQIGSTNDNGITTWQPSKTLNYPVSLASTGTIAIDQRGIISAGIAIIQFNTGSGTPEYDCIQMLYATRINIGKMNGANCVTR